MAQSVVERKLSEANYCLTLEEAQAWVAAAAVACKAFSFYFILFLDSHACNEIRYIEVETRKWRCWKQATWEQKYNYGGGKRNAINLCMRHFCYKIVHAMCFFHYYLYIRRMKNMLCVGGCMHVCMHAQKMSPSNIKNIICRLLQLSCLFSHAVFFHSFEVFLIYNVGTTMWVNFLIFHKIASRYFGVCYLVQCIHTHMFMHSCIHAYNVCIKKYTWRKI